MLVIDDEDTARSVAGMMLEHIGFEVLSAAGGEAGLRIFRERSDELRLVLLDMVMPGLSGEQVFREMRRIDPSIPVLLSSGYNEQEATSVFTGKGLAGFIQKPYGLQSLTDKVRSALEPRK